jgi:hypothetical protein
MVRIKRNALGQRSTEGDVGDGEQYILVVEELLLA